ncbi:hypothetical protein C8F04DRAFT_1253502 [Mycena alexandri]|uniref:Uncharacterized protein n=1 Tax=Mycena alexandri TaxID=1745969 RepID=A0AAD6T708_9AGAR|nr:hypothetical protein C8F04DRAFT_1253502 [Mycena alexandri]
MNVYYDKEGARKALEEAIEASKVNLLTQNDVAIQHLSVLDVDRLAVQVTGERNVIWRLGPANEKGEVEEEFSFHMQGVIAQLSLIPGNIEGLDVNRGINTSQGITLVGLGSPKFNDSVDRLSDLYALFARYFPPNSMSRWNANVDEGDTVLKASNRFFTAVEDDPTAEHIRFAKGVDPLNKLERFVSDSLVHTEANVVKYHKHNKTKEGETTIEVAFPSNFRVGDIVEIHASAIAFKTQGRQSTIKMHCNLSGVTLIDSSFSKKTEEAKRSAAIAVIVPKNKLRRKNPYPTSNEPGGKKTRQNEGSGGEPDRQNVSR